MADLAHMGGRIRTLRENCFSENHEVPKGMYPSDCPECIMTWLLLGDGGFCLMCRHPVYYIGPGHD